MSIFNTITPAKTLVGLSENDEYYCIIINDDGNFSIEWRTKPYSFKDFIYEVVDTSKPFTLVRCVPYQYVWRKNFCVPRHYSQRIVLGQIVQIVQREIPLPLSEINLDFETVPIENNPLQRVHCNALRKSYADELMLNEDTVLNCELHSFLRGIEYSNPRDPNARYLIKDKVVQFTNDGIIFDTNLDNATWRPSTTPDPDGDVLDYTLFYMALGASIWNIDPI
ncbi:hypothetical protein B0187_04235 [Haemophilus paracuniculus]|uniref:Uncharacterized protein n=1 Tax=Haemophilus paracuniculus TaxID=734 RepID=A0A1T0ATY7_9PAST|nr:hypothetical protein [Haemophilus paracuniculus]OOS00159.1 hypothetical protein B0187_04235 [Haemophilus paracuniculus]